MMFALCAAVTCSGRGAWSPRTRTGRSVRCRAREIAFTEMPLSSRMRTSVVSSMKAISSFTSTVPTSNSTPV